MSTPDDSPALDGADDALEAKDAEKASIRDLLVSAAFELFTEHGYEGTTVDDIVRHAGVGRRSFFRQFPTKEAVVFPDHDRALAELIAYMADGPRDADPVGRACDATLLVVRMYAENADFSARRYALTRSVPALRKHETTVVRSYERALAAYLERRFAALPDGGLRAHVIAAGIVAAHNYGLRAWLRSGARGDAAPSVREALDLVRGTWSGSGESVVVVARTGAPMWQVMQRLETALKDTP
ncbi:TetR/AcrR family transcriptional regulator [Streptomyces sp. NBC_00687]|uniref:TetR/AcrR family transcriptional regulator n=1 Tax=Streptomyces sp. NBC_00687 TaxID=2975807 RepID=UPI002255782F|nr:TetR/AcrR family transcriptional regulator [Streptomyces sp. NBC_00687]MCX4919022.1 TetR/AcrR family transcriptional regulator [Streptomyces sp. NBC_00687]